MSRRKLKGNFARRKRFDLLMLCVLLFFAAWCSLYFRLGVVGSVVLYLVVPTLYLCFREKKNYLKILLACTMLTAFGTSLDVIGEHNLTWHIALSSPVLTYLVWGVTPVGLLLWGFCVAFFTIVFYEHFLDDEKHPALSKNFLYALIPSGLLFFIVGFTALLNPHALDAPYAYLLLFGAAELPLLWVLLRKPTLLYKMLWLGAFFFALNFIFELTALSLHQWSFPGQYIGWVRIWGLSFPWEELVLWIALSSPTVIFYYETFFDDGT
jgi:hypothetical protein